VANADVTGGDRRDVTIRFGYSARWNDHNAYPRALVARPPHEWAFRPVRVAFDGMRGRPWCSFATREGEFAYASSLIPTNGGAWLFDTDHAEYLVTQARQHAASAGVAFERSAVVARLASDLASPRCLGAIAWSEAAASSIRALAREGSAPPPVIVVAYPGVIPPAPDAGAIRRVDSLLARLRPDTVKLLAIDGQIGVCNTSGRKNVAEAVRCYRELRARGLPVELVVVEASDVADSDGVHCLPRLSRAEMWRVFARCDVLLFLSRQDSFGYVIVEAMANGVACVAVRGRSVPATCELIEDGRTGFLVRYLDAPAYPGYACSLDRVDLAAKTAALVLRPALRSEIASAALRAFAPGGQFDVERRNRSVAMLIGRMEKPSALSSYPW
jgi:glycosyltransferase involved in cell wall biosynthesis